MGGTSADIGLVTEAGINEASARDTHIADYPLLVPMFDIETIGAGGGSIAHVDAAGTFKVGPRSAGAVPGPGCLRAAAATEPTITDAHLVLGRHRPRALPGRRDARWTSRRARGGRRPPRRASSGWSGSRRRAGILTLANANMAQTIRSITVERGRDPRDFALVAFGGAGPLHAAELAAMLGVPEVLVPPHPGITSATGLLTSDLRYDSMATVFAVEGSGRRPRRSTRASTSLADELLARLRPGRRGRRRGGRRALPRLPLRRPGLRAADPGRRRGLHRRRRWPRSTAPTRPSTGTRSATRSRSSTCASRRPDRARSCSASSVEAGTLEAGRDRRGDHRVARRRRADGRSPRGTCCASACPSTNRSRARRSSTSATRRSPCRRAGRRRPRPPAHSSSPPRRPAHDRHRLPPRRRRHHRRGDRRQPALDRRRDGLPPRAHVLLVDHPRVRGLRLRAVRPRGPPAVRGHAVHAAAVRADRRLPGRHHAPLRRSSATRGARATSSSTTIPTTAPPTSPTSASACRSSSPANWSASP